ncbi:hypothetical protein ABT173_11240 [Streptomyces sp. NPDC001795]|uniref:hypothetical protein n=1 Tax=Streptomyces sp. NPDC001795 TaxID=3154525 RepID=UPI0033342429
MARSDTSVVRQRHESGTALGELADAGHVTDLVGRPFAQQMNQLTLVLDNYQAAVRRTGVSSGAVDHAGPALGPRPLPVTANP